MVQMLSLTPLLLYIHWELQHCAWWSFRIRFYIDSTVLLVALVLSSSLLFNQGMAE